MDPFTIATIGLKLGSLFSGNSASKYAALANKNRGRLMALKNSRERRQLIRQSYIARATTTAGAAAMDGEGGLGSSPVLGSLFGTLGQQQTELDFLTRAGQLEKKITRFGGKSDAATTTAGIFSGLGDLTNLYGSTFPTTDESKV